MARHARPLSPHLQIYKYQLTSVLSILHRVTGVISILGSFCLLAWLVGLAWDESLYRFLQKIAVSIPAQVIMFAWSYALIYHLCNGVRHMLWDQERGLDMPDVYKSGKWMVSISIALTILIWITK